MELKAISPIDGRYNQYTNYYKDHFSEFAFIKNRLIFEIDYFIFLLKLNYSQFPLDTELVTYMFSLKSSIKKEDIVSIKLIENKIHHDVKSIEYFLADYLKKSNYHQYVNLLHFGLTSQDVNTFAYSYSLKHWYENIFKDLYHEFTNILTDKSRLWSDIVIIGRTHGQPATWTRLDKEMSVFLYKLNYEFSQLENYDFTTKMGGSVGNLTSHNILDNTKDWNVLLSFFLKDNYKLERSELTTQIHNYNEYAHFFDTLKIMSSILIDFCRDIWIYCMSEELILNKPSTHVGSSIMPHKVNPIEFENAEGNLKITVMWLEFLSRELCQSRLQRDLTDSTILRNLGVVFSHFHIAIKQLVRGISYLEANKERINYILMNNLSSMSEIEQHKLRLKNNVDGYNSIKELSDSFSKLSIEKKREKMNEYKEYFL
uniref:Fumarate lyase N-terminal domain-containing protein n=1 Tax=viral metagenome TaxID=1070528 RepID=A0A6C0KJF0_9ZZZZ